MACSVSKAVAQGLECCCCCFLCVKVHIEGKRQRSTKLSHWHWWAMVCTSAAESPKTGRSLFYVYIARTVMQPQCKAEMIEGALGELTLVGAQRGANPECYVLANTLLKHQLCLPSGKLRWWLLGTFQPCLEANRSSCGSHTVALVLVFPFMCVAKCTLKELQLISWTWW